jgi:hypothetical protein
LSVDETVVKLACRGDDQAFSLIHQAFYSIDRHKDIALLSLPENKNSSQRMKALLNGQSSEGMLLYYYLVMETLHGKNVMSMTLDRLVEAMIELLFGDRY